jgi:pyrroline-5-carboxylate reductase
MLTASENLARGSIRSKKQPANGVEKMKTDFSKSRIAVLGAGKMGGILVKALIEKHKLSPERVRATVAHEPRVKDLSAKLGVAVTTDNLAAVDGADVVLICVKPQVVQELTEQIADKITDKQLIISVAASVHTSQIEMALGPGVPVIRAMPNTPSVVGQGMTALCKGMYAKPEHVDAASALFNAVGRTVVVDEKHMDAVTGLSASGPAYIYIILESLAEAGVKVGLPRDIATLLAAQTTLGAATVVLETGDHPALLKDAVTTPAGCTVDGIMELEEGKLRVTLIKAVVKATQRAKELANG